VPKPGPDPLARFKAMTPRELTNYVDALLDSAPPIPLELVEDLEDRQRVGRVRWRRRRAKGILRGDG